MRAATHVATNASTLRLWLEVQGPSTGCTAESRNARAPKLLALQCVLRRGSLGSLKHPLSFSCIFQVLEEAALSVRTQLGVPCCFFEREGWEPHGASAPPRTLPHREGYIQRACPLALRVTLGTGLRQQHDRSTPRAQSAPEV